MRLGDSPNDGTVKFCENGAKAVSWKPPKSVWTRNSLLAIASVSLGEQSDYWLEYQGRLTQPMRYDKAADHYVPIEWGEAFAMIAAHLK